jgi:copper resistance protein D
MLAALLIVTRAIHIAASILIAGSFTFEVVALGLVRRSVSDDSREVERSLVRLAAWILVAALVSAVLWLWLEVASMSGLSLAGSFSTTEWQTVLFRTKFGHVWQLRLGLIVIAFVLIASGLARSPRNGSGLVGTPRCDPTVSPDKVRRATILVLWLLSIVLLVSLALISHAAAARVQPLGLIGDALHLCAAGAWIGGLFPLVIFLTRAQVSLSSAKISLPIIARFSTLSLSCVSVLIVSGVCNSWLLVGSIHALFTTLYGWLLLFKLALFGILLGFGARNRLAIKTRASTAQTSSDFLHQLRRNVICETCLGAAVVVIVACLGMTPPAQHSWR